MPKESFHVYNQKGFVLPPADICVEDIDWTWEWNGKQITFSLAEGHTNAGDLLSNWEELIHGGYSFERSENGDKIILWFEG